jgi:hypothetical protein
MKPKGKMKSFLPCALLVSLAFAGQGRAEDVSKLSSDLSRMRGEVENLTTDLAAKKEEFRSRLRSLATQKTDLEMELQREELRLRQFKEAQAKQRARVARNEERKHTLKPTLLKSIGLIRDAVRAGLPFQKHERAGDLDKLERQLQEGTLSSPTALARLWGKVQDEFRLGRENGLYRQVIQVNGTEMLAEVVRVGMVFLLFKTRDGHYGRALKKGDRWTYRLYQDRDDIERAAALFDAFKKRIRVGFFELPAVELPERAGEHP